MTKDILLEKLDNYFKETNFDQEVEVALKSDIELLGKKKDGEAIRGFGLYTTWEIDGGAYEFWFPAILTKDGADSLDDDELMETGSWDEFDNASSPLSTEIQDKVYKPMWALIEELEEIDLDEELFDMFYASVRERLSKHLKNLEPLIKDTFNVVEPLILSTQGHVD